MMSQEFKKVLKSTGIMVGFNLAVLAGMLLLNHMTQDIEATPCVDPLNVWPPGDYCILRKGGSCPAGFHGSVGNEGRVCVDTEDYNNLDRFGPPATSIGDIADGCPGVFAPEYSADTMRLCCK